MTDETPLGFRERPTPPTQRRTVRQELDHAALQLAMYHNRLDVAEYNTAPWPDLDVAGRAQYLREAKRTIGALGLLGWAPLHPHATLYLTDERDSLKSLRETLAVAQGALPQWAEEWGIVREEEAERHAERIGRLISEIDRQRPLGPDGKHGDLHTPSCGCEDR